LKRLAEVVPQKLGEILVKHGPSVLTDPKLCQNLLKDYCGDYKEEIAVLVSAVSERIPSDLFVSQSGIQREFLRALLVKRLRKNCSLSVSDAQWAVDSWSLAIRIFSRSQSAPAVEGGNTAAPLSPIPESLTFGLIGKSGRAIRAVAFSPLGDAVVSGGDDAAIRWWDLSSREMTILHECDGPVSAVAFSPNGVLVATASETRDRATCVIQIFDLHSGELSHMGYAGTNSPSVVFSAGGKSLAWASAGPECEIQVWNLQTGQRRLLRGHGKGPSSISFAADGRELASADGDLSNPAIRLWNLETGTARVLGRSKRQITAIAFIAEGRLASGSWDETVRLWDRRNGEARVLGKNCSCICCLAVSNKGEKVAACSLDSKIRVWEISSERSRTVGESPGINSVAFSMDGRALVTGGVDGSLLLWDAAI